MSSLWTPGGERPIRRDSPAGERPAEPSSVGPGAEPSEEEIRAQMAELQQELARTPAEVVIANHALGLFNLASLHLSQQPPQLDQARLAIDAMAALVDGLGDRLGEDAHVLSDGLAQLRIAYVQIHAAQQAETGGDNSGSSSGSSGSSGPASGEATEGDDA